MRRFDDDEIKEILKIMSNCKILIVNKLVFILFLYLLVII